MKKEYFTLWKLLREQGAVEYDTVFNEHDLLKYCKIMDLDDM